MTAKLEVKDRGLAALFQRAKDIKNSYVKVGVLADDGEETHGDLTTAEIAAVLHFGTKDGNIPARPFATTTFEEQREALIEIGKKLITAVLDGKMPIKDALDVMGSRLSSDMKAKITAGVPPPNTYEVALRKAKTGKTAKHFRGQPKTIGEGFAQVGAVAAVKPLIDTGALLNSITWSSVVGGHE